MPCARTPQEVEFLEYFRRIDKSAIKKVFSQYRSTDPVGYATSLVLARILKVKERISSDRELSEKLAKIRIYRKAIGISHHEIPALIRSQLLAGFRSQVDLPWQRKRSDSYIANFAHGSHSLSETSLCLRDPRRRV